MMVKRRGFTIVELFAVMVIIVLIGAGVAFEAQGTLDRVHLNDAGQKLLAISQQAHRTASYEHSLCRMHIRPAEGVVRLEVKAVGVPVDLSQAVAIPAVNDKPTWPTWSLTNDVRVSRTYVEKQVDANPAGEYIISFYPDGTSDTAGVQLSLSDKSVSLQVSGHTGRSKLIDGVLELPKNPMMTFPPSATKFGL